MILPAAPSSVYNPAYVDAWGASILKDDSGIYHMWVSVTDNNCDIQYWARNSLVVHATSSSPTGPYVYQDDARMCSLSESNGEYAVCGGS